MMAFFNVRGKSKLIMVTLLIVSIIAVYSIPMSVYATEDNPREPTVTEEVSTDSSGLEPTEETEQESPTESTEGTEQELQLEPTEDTEQELPPDPDLINYVVEYETEAGEKLLDDKVVEDQQVGEEVSEDAEEIEGYSADESSKSLILEEEENTITFIYTQIEAEEELPPAEEDLLPTEEELPTVVTTPGAVEEAVTEPAIIVEPTAASLKITHRLIVGDQYIDDVRTVEGLEVGQTIDLETYILVEEWFELTSDVNNITLNEEQTSILLEYKPVEGFVVIIPESIPADAPDM